MFYISTRVILLVAQSKRSYNYLFINSSDLLLYYCIIVLLIILYYFGPFHSHAYRSEHLNSRLIGIYQSTGNKGIGAMIINQSNNEISKIDEMSKN